MLRTIRSSPKTSSTEKNGQRKDKRNVQGRSDSSAPWKARASLPCKMHASDPWRFWPAQVQIHSQFHFQDDDPYIQNPKSLCNVNTTMNNNYKNRCPHLAQHDQHLAIWLGYVDQLTSSAAHTTKTSRRRATPTAGDTGLQQTQTRVHKTVKQFW